MNYIESDTFFLNEVKARFGKWTPGEAEVSDWLFYLKGMDESVALKAIREQKAETRYNTPALSTFRAKARGFMPHKEETKKPDDTVFVMYEGGGRGTLLAGYYLPIVVSPKEMHLVGKAAERTRQMHEDRVGGIWKVYTNATSKQMNDIRHGFYEAGFELRGKDRMEKEE